MRFGGPRAPEPPSEREEVLVSVCRGIVEEMEVGGKLLQFCWELDVFQRLFGGGSSFVPSADASGGSGAEGTEEGESGVAPIIRK